MKDFEQLFEQVAEQIDWGRIEKTMQLLGWTWVTNEVNIYSLIKTAKSLCKDAYDLGVEHNVMCESSSGGFHAFYKPEYNELSLYFAVENGCSNYYE